MPQATKTNPDPPNASASGRFHYLQEPDYSKPLFEFSPESRNRILWRLRRLYGEAAASNYFPELERLCRVHHAHKSREILDSEASYLSEERFSEKDIILITYGDLLSGESGSPLDSLARFCDSYLEGNINTLHILPFFPYSSDRGFSVKDFETVDPKLGGWEDILALKSKYNLMFDGVFNHISSQSKWFREFLNGDPYYGGFFIVFNSPDELTEEQRAQIFRPRTSDILTRVETINGPRYVWTTFSADQVDLNFKNPDLLMRIVEILLFYVRQGADVIRLDAVTYLWSELGTSCVHLEQTHEIIKLFRDIMDNVAPGAAIITETNVPHEENISYFGDGTDEARMVYNFALPPLVLHTFYTGDATALSKWAESLTLVSNTVHFFNFLDSHDGIGVMGVKGILSDEEIAGMIERVKEHGGLISYKSGKHGQEPYEMNITWFSALNRRRDEAHEDEAFQVKRFVASRMVSFVLQGVPGIYLHSLIGTRNDLEAVLASEHNRDINRTIIDEKLIYQALEDPMSKVSRINRELGRLISIRTRQKAFHPAGDQRVLLLTPEVFSVFRISPDGEQRILALINVTDRELRLKIPLTELGSQSDYWFDLVSEMEYFADEGVLGVLIEPYDMIWLEERQDEEDLD